MDFSEFLFFAGFEIVISSWIYQGIYSAKAKRYGKSFENKGWVHLIKELVKIDFSWNGFLSALAWLMFLFVLLNVVTSMSPLLGLAYFIVRPFLILILGMVSSIIWPR